MWDFTYPEIEKNPSYDYTECSTTYSGEHGHGANMCQDSGWISNPYFGRNESAQYPNSLQHPPRKPSLEETLQSFIQSTTQRFESVDASIARIETRVGELAEIVGKLVQHNRMEELIIEENGFEYEDDAMSSGVDNLEGEEEEITEWVEELSMATINTLCDVMICEVSKPLTPVNQYFHYIIASDTFFRVSWQDYICEGEVKPAHAANLSVEGDSTRENRTICVLLIISGPADVDDEDELIQVMEWLKLEKEFG